MVRTVSALIAGVALACALVIGAAGPGTRLGFWDYSQGLSMIRFISAPKEIAGAVSLSPLFTAAGLSLIAAIAAFFARNRRTSVLALVGALAAGVAGVVPIKMKQAFEANPFIHEVTTDFDDPPAIRRAADMPRKNPADYRGADPVPNATDGITVAQAQQKAFPDIAPIEAKADLESAVAAAKAVVGDMGMKILAEGPASDQAGSGWLIEAVATSRWFGFKDDFIVRLTPTGEGTTRIDLRSKSRVGGSDLGANASRVRDFAKRFNARMAAD